MRWETCGAHLVRNVSRHYAFVNAASPVNQIIVEPRTTIATKAAIEKEAPLLDRHLRDTRSISLQEYGFIPNPISNGRQGEQETRTGYVSVPNFFEIRYKV